MDELKHYTDALHALPYSGHVMCRCTTMPADLAATSPIEQALESSWREFDSGVKALLQKGVADA